MSSKEAKDVKSASNVVRVMSIVCLTLLGIVSTIGVFWGRDGLLNVGIGILIAIGLAIFFLGDEFLMFGGRR